MAKKLRAKADDEQVPRQPIQKSPDWKRRVRQGEKIARILGLLQLIQSRGRWNTRSLAEELNCSERTVYRDLEVLEFAGVPYYRDGADDSIRVRPDYKFPVPNLTSEELIGQALATAVTRTPGLDVGPGATPTTRKLAAMSGESVRQLLADAAKLVCVLDLKLADHSRHSEAIKTIQFALLHGKQVVGQYESPYESGPVHLRLHPYRLCLIKNAWYIIGRASDATEVRTYRVARFKTLRMLDQPASVPVDFDLKTYFGNAWAVFRGPTTYDVEIWFTTASAKVVTETVWHPTQKAKWNPDGSVALTFRVDGLEEIVNWIMSWAGRAKVVQPQELRELVRDRLRQALAMHEP